MGSPSDGRGAVLRWRSPESSPDVEASARRVNAVAPSHRWTPDPSRAKLDAARARTMANQKTRTHGRRGLPLLAALLLTGACARAASTPSSPPSQHVAAPPPKLAVPLSVDNRPMLRPQARHLLNRLAFGPRELDLASAEGTSAQLWMARQL